MGKNTYMSHLFSFFGKHFKNNKKEKEKEKTKKRKSKNNYSSLGTRRMPTRRLELLRDASDFRRSSR